MRSCRYMYIWRLHGWLRYDTRCYFNVRSKADIGLSQLNLPNGTDNWLWELLGKWELGACIQCAQLFWTSAETEGWCDWICELLTTARDARELWICCMEPGDLWLGEVAKLTNIGPYSKMDFIISRWTANWRANDHAPSLRWWHYPIGHFGGRTTGVGGSSRPSQPQIGPYSLLINVDKTKVMASDCIIACRIVIVNEQLEQVDRGPTLPYIGSLITEDDQCTTEFRTGLNRGQAIGASLQKIRKITAYRFQRRYD